MHSSFLFFHSHIHTWRLRRFTYLHAEDHPLTPFHGCIGLFSPPLPPPVQPSPVQENSSVLVTTVGKEVRKKERFCLDLPSHLHHPRNVVASPPPSPSHRGPFSTANHHHSAHSALHVFGGGGERTRVEGASFLTGYTGEAGGSKKGLEGGSEGERRRE